MHASIWMPIFATTKTAFSYTTQVSHVQAPQTQPQPLVTTEDRQAVSQCYAARRIRGGMAPRPPLAQLDRFEDIGWAGLGVW